MSRGNAAGLEDYEDGPINDRRGLYKELPFWLRIGPMRWQFSDRELDFIHVDYPAFEY